MRGASCAVGRERWGRCDGGKGAGGCEDGTVRESCWVDVCGGRGSYPSKSSRVYVVWGEKRCRVETRCNRCWAGKSGQGFGEWRYVGVVIDCCIAHPSYRAKRRGV